MQGITRYTLPREAGLAAVARWRSFGHCCLSWHGLKISANSFTASLPMPQSVCIICTVPDINT